MLRAGPTFSYALDQQSALALGYRWMHVSNGKGVGPDNPSYDAHGVSLQYQRRF